MNTCKQCIHFDVCPSEYIATGMSELCLNFKDSAKFVELPHPLGATVYMPIYGYDSWENRKYSNILEIEFTLSMLYGINKRFFLTREEAEAKLEEYMNA